MLGVTNFESRDAEPLIMRIHPNNANTAVLYGCMPSIERECVITDTKAVALAQVVAPPSQI